MAAGAGRRAAPGRGAHPGLPTCVEHLTAAAQPSLGSGTPTLTAWLDEHAHTLKHAADGARQVLAALARLPVHGYRSDLCG
jgi:hypothetical protein